MSDSAARSAALLPADLSSPEELLQSVLNISLSAVILFRPLYQAAAADPEDLAIEYLNPAARQMLKLSEQQPSKSALQLFPHLKPTGVWDFYLQVLRSGQPGRFEVNYQHDGLDNYFHLAAQTSGQLLVVSFNDTAHHNRTAVEESLRRSQASEQKARAEAELQRQQLHDIFMQTPAMVCILEGPAHVFKLVNPPYQRLVGDRPLLGRPIAEAMPELAGQPIFSLLDRVYQTGESYHAFEMLVQLDHENAGGKLGENYYNFTYQATRNLAGEVDGILVFAYEVTTQVRARQQIEESHEQVRVLNQQLETRVLERTRDIEKARAEAHRHRRRLELLFMQAPAAICILSGPDLVYELVNPGYQQLFPGRQLLGKPILEALPEIADNPVYRTFRQVYETGITHEEQRLLIPFRRPEDGQMEDRYFKYIQQARINEEGRIDGVLVFAFEVTEQENARKAIESSERQLRLITDSLPVLIGYLDKEEKYRFANQAYIPWFNQPPESLLGRPVRDVVGEAAYAGVKKYIDRALAGERLDFEARMPYRDNFVKHIHTSYVPDVRNGEVVGFYTLVTDITGRVQNREALRESERQAQELASEVAAANRELQQINQQLVRTNVDLDNFIYTASHDLKAPILNIAGLLEVLQGQLPAEALQSPSTRRIMELISTSVQRFRRTIDHLTDITKLQKENSTEASRVDLAALIADVQLDLEPAIRQHNVQVEVDVEACSTIRFSEKNLRSIVYNLFSNAVKYHDPARRPLVQLSCMPAGDYLMLSVQDNGLGIDLAQEHKLFAMFKRLHNHVEGSGVGLYMVKKIIENAGGKIEVQSKVGEGSTFKVYFPYEA